MRSTYSPIGLLLCACLLLLTLAAPGGAMAACGGIKINADKPKTSDGQTIRTAGELSAALRKARGGETFLLAGGDYGGLKISQAFKKPVTIRSATPQSPACLTKLRIVKGGNVTLEGMVFNYSYKSGDKHQVNHFEIRGSHNVTISNSVFDGDYKAGIGHGRGLFISGSSKITITNNTFRKWSRAMLVLRSTNLTFRHNRIYDIRVDGMTLSGIENVSIEGNRFYNFRAGSSRDHRDMIQLMRTTDTGSSNVEIKDNIFDIGNGDWTQTIFMGKSGKNTKDPLLRHRNILIENNVIYNAHLHGISVHGVDDLAIRRNSIIRIPRPKGGKQSIPRINVTASTSVVIEQNVVSQITGYQNQRDWAVLNNAIIQDQSPSARGFYEREFIVYATGATNGFHEYGVRPGSEIDRLNAGSTLVQNYPTRH